MEKNGFKNLLLVILLVLVSFSWVLANSSRKTLINNTELNQEMGEVVAIVNGVNIYQQDFDSLYESAIASLGVDPKFLGEQDLADFRTEIIEYLINDEIVKVAARKAGIIISDDMIDDEIDNIIEMVGGDEEFEKILVENKLDMDSLKQQVEAQLISQEYMNYVTSSQNVEVTDEEVASLYNNFADPDDVNMPELAEVYDEIVSMLKQQKESDVYYDILNSLLEEAEIEIFIN